MWNRWNAGQSLHQIGRVFGKSHVSIHFMLSQHGGIVPAARRRSLLTLTLAEREDISRGIASGSSIRDIAKGLQRAGGVPVGPRRAPPPGPPTSLSSQSSRSPGLGVGLAAQSVPSCHPPEVANDRCE